MIVFILTNTCLYGCSSIRYHWIKRKGRPASRDIAPIVVCNHVSYIEPIFFFYELFPTMVASESHDALPFVGTIVRAMQVDAHLFWPEVFLIMLLYLSDFYSFLY